MFENSSIILNETKSVGTTASPRFYESIPKLWELIFLQNPFSFSYVELTLNYKYIKYLSC
nr:hypothetical protein [Leptospira noguchii]